MAIRKGRKKVTTTEPTLTESTTTSEPIITPAPADVISEAISKEQAPRPPQPEFKAADPSTFDKPVKVDLGKWVVKEVELGRCKGVVGAKPEVKLQDGTTFRYVYYMLTGPDGHPFMGFGNGLEATFQLAINQINEHYNAYTGYDENID